MRSIIENVIIDNMKVNNVNIDNLYEITIVIIIH